MSSTSIDGREFVRQADHLLHLIQCAMNSHPKIPAGRHVRLNPAPNGFEAIYCRLFALYSNDDVKPFHEPLNAILHNCPSYYTDPNFAGAKPMSLRKLLDNLAEGKYGDQAAVLEDVDTLVDNCVRFNGEQNTLTFLAIRLRERLRDALKPAPSDKVQEFADLGEMCDNDVMTRVLNMVKAEAPGLIDEEEDVDLAGMHQGLMEDCLAIMQASLRVG